MNRVIMGLLVIALALAALFPLTINQSVVALGLTHHLLIDRESFLILFAALFGMMGGLRVVPVLALLLGSFFTGPLITGIVAALLIYDRSQKNTSWWFLLKDYFFLSFLVLASGLPEPLRSIATYCGVVGVAFDFNRGMLGLMPAVLFIHTTKGMVLEDDQIFIFAGVFIFLNLLWVWVNGSGRVSALWKNGVALYLLTFSFLIKDHSFLPAIVAAVLAVEVSDQLKLKDPTKKIWYMVAVSLLFAGFPGFVHEVAAFALAQRGMLWAVPFFPFFLVYLGLGSTTREGELENEGRYPIWMLALVGLLAFSGVWWSSIFPPLTDLGRWSGISLMNYLFEHPTEETNNLDQNVILASMGLTVLGGLIGFLLFKFFKPKDKLQKLEQVFSGMSSRSRVGFYRTARVIPTQHAWVTDKYNEPHLTVDDYLRRVVVGFVILGLLWVGLSLLRNGSVG